MDSLPLVLVWIVPGLLGMRWMTVKGYTKAILACSLLYAPLVLICALLLGPLLLLSAWLMPGSLNGMRPGRNNALERQTTQLDPEWLNKLMQALEQLAMAIQHSRSLTPDQREELLGLLEDTRGLLEQPLLDLTLLAGNAETIFLVVERMSDLNSLAAALYRLIEESRPR